MKKTYFQPIVIETNISLTGVICASVGVEKNPMENPIPGGPTSAPARKLYV